MHVFLSYPLADRKLATQLREELNRDGLSIWAFDAQEKAGVEWQKQIEEAIRSAEDILILVGPRSSDDAAQHLEWRAALQAVWQDSHKRLIPILLPDAILPPFVFGDASGDETQVIRIVDPRDIRAAAEAIRGALRRGNDAPNFSRSTQDSVDVVTKGSQSYAVEGERNERLLEIKKFAEHLKH